MHMSKQPQALRTLAWQRRWRELNRIPNISNLSTRSRDCHATRPLRKPHQSCQVRGTLEVRTTSQPHLCRSLIRRRITGLGRCCWTLQTYHRLSAASPSRVTGREMRRKKRRRSGRKCAEYGAQAVRTCASGGNDVAATLR